MNQDQVKSRLLKLEKNVDDFTLIFSGKTSKKVDGLYHPDKREIIIHNRNFTDENSNVNENALMYTAIHEFAHHLQFTRSPVPISSKAHTGNFWDIFHRLLFDAEEKKVYENLFKNDSRFVNLTKQIREKFLNVNGQLMKDFGRLLLHAYELCIQLNVSFEDYVDRELLLHRKEAKSIMKVFTKDANPELGFENMKMVANIRDDDIRSMAEEAFAEGKSPDMVKAEFVARPKPENVLERLVTERERIENSIERLSVRLRDIEKRIEEIEE
ncbi:hypothetical protein ACFL20_03370 [Spirochaetota bacterium]